jgi:hypothetical protein
MRENLHRLYIFFKGEIQIVYAKFKGTWCMTGEILQILCMCNIFQDG